MLSSGLNAQNIISCGSNGNHMYSNPSYPIVAIGISKDVGYYLNAATVGNANTALVLAAVFPGIKPSVTSPYLIVILSIENIFNPHLTTLIDSHLPVVDDKSSTPCP